MSEANRLEQAFSDKIKEQSRIYRIMTETEGWQELMKELDDLTSANVTELINEDDEKKANQKRLILRGMLMVKTMVDTTIKAGESIIKSENEESEEAPQ